MAHYLVSGRPLPDRLADLQSKLADRAFVQLRPFGSALTASLEGARRLPDGTAIWEEEDYCRPPLAQEREAVLDRYFEGLAVEPVERGAGWKRIADLPALFPALAEG
jgi:hypothetical protein